ncbi:MAG: hypothetical protein UDG94_10735, partial [Peptococcaceae bacterium]|nr:hypothetical protein [Peptococcaceae bacterium]
IHCSVAFSSTGFCSLGCLIFKEQPAASATAHLYYHNSGILVKSFFEVFHQKFFLICSVALAMCIYYHLYEMIASTFFRFLTISFQRFSFCDFLLAGAHALGMQAIIIHFSLQSCPFWQIYCISQSPCSFVR